MALPVVFISVVFPKRAVLAAGAFGTILMLALAFTLCAS